MTDVTITEQVINVTVTPGPTVLVDITTQSTVVTVTPPPPVQVAVTPPPPTAVDVTPPAPIQITVGGGITAPIARGDLPAEIAYEDEVNTFTLRQNIADLNAPEFEHLARFMATD